jgi:hypothetical protein
LLTTPIGMDRALMAYTSWESKIELIKQREAHRIEQRRLPYSKISARLVDVWGEC